jgi:hypothetical protein
MSRKSRRPAHCEPGSIKDARELGERLRPSRDRLLASDLAKLGRAGRLWAACADATFGYAREADMTYAVTLGDSAGIDRKAAAKFLHRLSDLGVFVSYAAPLGSHAMSELRLPSLETWSRSRVNSDEAHQSGGLDWGATRVTESLRDSMPQRPNVDEPAMSLACLRTGRPGRRAHFRWRTFRNPSSSTWRCGPFASAMMRLSVLCATSSIGATSPGPSTRCLGNPRTRDPETSALEVIRSSSLALSSRCG